jgi:hypothetical protein
MKTFTRFAAAISFFFCFLGGIALLQPALSEPKADDFLFVALGFFLMDMAFFFGAMLWLAAERWCLRRER